MTPCCSRSMLQLPCWHRSQPCSRLITWAIRHCSRYWRALPSSACGLPGTCVAALNAARLPARLPRLHTRSSMPTFEETYGTSEPIAVIGLACRFPEARDSAQYWQNLLTGRECSRHFSREELLAAGLSAELIDNPDFVNVAAVIDDADRFDAALFGYSRQEAESIDPQQRLFLQIVWHALEDAGFAPREVAHKTGVFASGRMSTYPGRDAIRVTEVAQVKGLQALMGNDKDYLASRAAYKLNLRGPAMSVQTACSSSLVAVHMACESLRSGECEMAVAGGVAVSFPQQAGYLYQPGMIFSPDGRCRPFDASAQGTFAGNGVGAVTLRRLEDALRDGDPVLAVLRGSAINNDGHHKVGYTAPSVVGQREVIKDALLLADIDCASIGMLEAHGTGTPLGDPIEVQALRDSFARRTDIGGCALGSVKGNLGHLDTAAGIASLIKTILAVNHGRIPPSINVEQINPALQLEQSPFYIPTQDRAWPAGPRRAGVSSFGIGGTNCHVIVEALPDALRAPGPKAQASTLLLSAASQHSLRQLAGLYAERLHAADAAADLAHTALHARQLELPFRLAVPLHEETAPALQAFAQGGSDALLYEGQPGQGAQVWLCSGQGSQWAGMGKSLYGQSKAFSESLDRSFAVCAAHLQPSLQSVMFGEHEALIDRMDYAQPAIVAFEVAMAAHWREAGMTPDLLIGHSVGEFAAVVIAGIYRLEDILPLVIARGRLMNHCAAQGSMLAVFCDVATLQPLALEHGVEIAVHNAEQHLVASGDRQGIDALAQALQERHVRHNRLSVAGAAHSRLLEPILDEFQQASAGLRAAPAKIPLISTLTGQPLAQAELERGDYWRRHLREPVRYHQALTHALQTGVTIALELGADAPLTGIGTRLEHAGVHWIASARRHKPHTAVLHDSLLRLFAAGASLPWRTLLPSVGTRVQAPLYAFDEQRYWCDAPQQPVATTQDLLLEAGRKVALQEGAHLDLPRLERLYQCVTRLHAIYVDQMVRQCVQDTIDRGVDPLSILRGGRLLPRHRQLLVRLLNACVEDGYYANERGLYRSARPVPHGQYPTLLAELRSCCEGLDVIADTVERAGEQLFAMMSGAVEPVSVIFPESASSGVEVLYQQFSFGRYFNQIAAGVVSGLIREHQQSGRGPLRILEVGGGTGGTTAWLLPELSSVADVRYCFTDISALFSRRAEEKFSEYDFVEYALFDLQKPAAEQGFPAEHYDLIVAANVIHATQHIGHTLQNLRPLLKPGGALLMREITRPMRLFDFVFGPLVLPLHDEQARGGELFLSTEHWQQQCMEHGFERLDWLPDDGSATSGISEHILLARTQAANIARAPLSVGHDSGNAVLGRQLGEHFYQPDWTDCAGQPQRWQTRLQHACEQLAARHGDTRRTPVFARSVPLPESLADLTLRWSADPFGVARVELGHCNNQGLWQLLGSADNQPAPRSTLPAPQTAVGTHYTWQWAATKVPDTSNAPLCIEPASVRAALAEAGIAHDPNATACLLIVEDGTLAEVASQVLKALTATDHPLLVVTRNAWSLGTHRTVCPEQRALWGLLRVACAEQPQRALAVIDLDGSDWQDLLPGLSAAQNGERWISVRQGVAQVQTLIVQRHQSASLPAQGFKDTGWHIVTGAFGGLGRLSTHWLVDQGASRIALLAPRCPHDGEQLIDTLQQQYGCEIRWVACDISDQAALATCLDELHADGGLSGAIHSAGLLDDTPLSNLDAARMQPLLQVKCSAARQLQAALADQGRYLLLYSSAAASLGAAGQGAHALASAYLDGLAESQVDARLHTVSIAWGAWGETGRAADDKLHARLAQGGMGTLTTGEGLWHLEQAVMRGVPWHLAMRIDPERIDPRRRLLAQTIEQPVTRSPIKGSSRNDALPAPGMTGDRQVDQQALSQWLSACICRQLRLSPDAAPAQHQDLMQLGLDSLLFLELSSDIQRQLGIRLDAGEAYRDLSIRGLSALLLSSTGKTAAADSAPSIVPQPDSRFEPFPLTPIQHAYWLGRTDLIDYGGVACHVLFEWDKAYADFDLGRFEHAWNALIARHDMLRMVIDSDGRQRILQHTPWYHLPRNDLRELPAEQQQQRLLSIREEMSYRVLPSDCWPLFEVTVSELDAGRCRLHMNLDLLLFDVQSFKVMMDDLAIAYAGQALDPLELTFRDYVMADLAQRDSLQWRQSWRYWQDTLEQLPGAPQLPLADELPKGQPRFRTVQARLDALRWNRFKAHCQHLGVTPSAALLALFAQTLESVSRTPEFTLNLTYFNRRALHPQVQQLIGDFTSVLLIDFQLGHGESPSQVMIDTQARLWQRLAHTAVNGVELMRELGRRQGQTRQPAMPVVFTSMLGMSLDGKAIDQAMTSTLGDPVYVFTQTPQVWLDHQVMEIDGELVFSWYCMEDVLADGLIDSLFQTYCDLLKTLADQPQGFDRPPELPRHDWSVNLDGERFDPQRLEAQLRRAPGVQTARISVDREKRTLLGELLSQQPSKVDDGIHAPLPLPLSELPRLSEGQRQEVDLTWQALESRARQGILSTLQKHGLFSEAGQRHDLAQVMTRLGAMPQFAGLLRQWLAMLCQQGRLQKEGQHYLALPHQAADGYGETLPDAEWSQTLGTYLDVCIEQHTELLRGDRSPLSLLFGNSDAVVKALYSNNPVLHCLNSALAQTAKALAGTRRDLRVLEVGAGTGATTRHVLPMLESHLSEYRFTDVSSLFLTQAREDFAAWPQLTCSILDVNQPVDFSQHPAQGYDLVIAVNVMHDAAHVTRSLKRLHRLLRSGGHLLLLEATERDSALQLASIGFIEGLSNFADERSEDDKAMLDLPRWRSAVQASGFSWVMNWPQRADDSMRQHFMLARAEGVSHLDLAAVAEQLEPHPAQWPLTLHQVEHVFTAPAARQTPQQTGESTPRQEVDPVLQDAVLQLWRELLGQDIDADSNFFLSGGDSLIATRMIARLNRMGHSASSMRNLFDNPRLSDFCSTLVSPSALTDDNPLALVRGRNERALFVFHASDGEVSAYLPLAKALDMQVFGLHATDALGSDSLKALAARYLQAIRRQQANGPYVLLGWSYGTFVAEETARLLRHQGEQVRLILLDPVCRQDFSFEDRPGLLRLMAESSKSIALPDDLERLPPAEQLNVFMNSATQAGVLKNPPQPQQAEQWLQRIEHLMKLLAQHPQPPRLDLPCLWLSAESRPQHWRPAEQDWQDRAATAHRESMPCDHWQLLLERDQVQRTAASISAWLAATQ
ncbi:Yersiniabactin polyketide/non-ribosomal peptide synthetase [Pseudomonas syringae pv. tagetis]|uniref:Yersiniabactin polyketide/non-ribosomal peptide synthetase n=1 Tax=Pseudomonas syringae pv. tagetis TaxID=129140 RepID=A0A0Q0C3S2_9PSED|nr:Yersiniabactin polyketide/non-ribosomal peptide synthetase [Pseudomonas syringae pv. tagetis]